MTERVEECWFVYGYRLKFFFIGFKRYHSAGDESNVSFDWEKCLKNKRFIGWFHTHLGQKHLDPSAADHRTMRSWVRATDKSLLCGIRSEKSSKIYDFCWISDSIFFKEVKFLEIGFILFGIIPNSIGKISKRGS